MVHRGIATLSGALMACYLLLGHFEPEFFLLHFYESLIYLMIVLMLFYFDDRWAYAFCMFAPPTWFLLTFSTGMLISRLSAPTPGPIRLLTMFTLLLGIAMVASSFYRWRREFSGMGKNVVTFTVSLFVVLAYYGTLAWWYWETLTHYRQR